MLLVAYQMVSVVIQCDQRARFTDDVNEGEGTSSGPHTTRKDAMNGSLEGTKTNVRKSTYAAGRRPGGSMKDSRNGDLDAMTSIEMGGGNESDSCVLRGFV